MPALIRRHTAPNNDTMKRKGQEADTNGYPSYFNFFFMLALETSQLEIKTNLSFLPFTLSPYNLQHQGPRKEFIYCVLFSPNL